MHSTPLPPAPIRLPREGPPAMSPRARRIARELNVPLQALPVPTEGRRITEKDVRAAAAALQVSPDVAAAPLRYPAQRSELDPAARTTAEAAAYAQQFIPQFTMDALIRSTPAARLQKQLAVDWQPASPPQTRDLFLRAVALLLADEKFRAFRAVIDGKDIVHRGEINVACTIPGTPYAPVLRSVDRLSLRALAETNAATAGRAQVNALIPSELNGALMTLHDLERFGIKEFRPLLRPGEAAALSIPAALPRSMWTRPATEKEPKELCIRPAWQVTLAADARIITSDLAATFLQEMTRFLESPARLNDRI